MKQNSPPAFWFTVNGEHPQEDKGKKYLSQSAEAEENEALRKELEKLKENTKVLTEVLLHLYQTTPRPSPVTQSQIDKLNKIS